MPEGKLGDKHLKERHDTDCKGQRGGGRGGELRDERGCCFSGPVG